MIAGVGAGVATAAGVDNAEAKSREGVGSGYRNGYKIHLHRHVSLMHHMVCTLPGEEHRTLFYDTDR